MESPSRSHQNANYPQISRNLKQANTFNSKVKRTAIVTSVENRKHNSKSPTHDRDLILKKTHAKGVVPYFQENAPFIKKKNSPTIDNTRMLLTSAPFEAKRAASKRRKNSEAYVFQPDFKESDFDVVWPHKSGLQPIKKTNKIQVQHPIAERYDEWANSTQSLQKEKQKESQLRGINGQFQSQLGADSIFDVRVESAKSSPKPITTTHINEINGEGKTWKLNLQKYREQSKDTEGVYIPPFSLEQEMLITSNEIVFPKITSPDRGLKSGRTSTAKKQRKKYMIEKQQSETLKDIKIKKSCTSAKKRDTFDITQNSTNTPIDVSNSYFQTDFGSINANQNNTINQEDSFVAVSKSPFTKNKLKLKKTSDWYQPGTQTKDSKQRLPADLRGKVNNQLEELMSLSSQKKVMTVLSLKQTAKITSLKQPVKINPEQEENKISQLDLCIEKINNKQNLQLQEQDQLEVYQPEVNPAFFNIFIEKRHADQLQKRNLDHESKMEVIYRVLKDQLRRAKKDLLQLKKDKQQEKIAAAEIKKRIKLAQERVASKDKDNFAGKVKPTGKLNSLGVPQYALDQDAQDSMPKDLKRIVKHLLHTEIRAHNRYCPCCRNYDEGNDLTPMQMGEFLEYIKQLHLKLKGGPQNNSKRKRADGEYLEYDSMSDITDLSDEGILATSMHKLTKEEQQKLAKYMQELRVLQSYAPPKHDCLSKKKNKKIENSRQVMEMELKVKQLKLDCSDKELSAHQFSQRSASLQCDSTEKFEIDMQTDLIDLKTTDQQVDVYDLNQQKHMSHQYPSNIGFKVMIDRSVGTDFNRKLISTTDWFYSDLNRRLLKEYFKKQNISPKEPEEKFKQFDLVVKNKFSKIYEPISTTEHRENGFQTDTGTGMKSSESLTNPQDPIFNGIQLKQLGEPEVSFLISMVKERSEKWECIEVLKELHAQAGYTAKLLTKEMIEGKVPICSVVDQHFTINKDGVMILLHRCQKLYQARSDVQKILTLLLKFHFDPKKANRQITESDQLLRRIRTILSQFQTEHKTYNESFIYDGKDLRSTIDKLLVNGDLPTPQVKTAIERQINDILKNEAGNDQSAGKGDGGLKAVEYIQDQKGKVQQNKNFYNTEKDTAIKSNSEITPNLSQKEQLLDQVKQELVVLQPGRKDPAFVRPSQILSASLESQQLLQSQQSLVGIKPLRVSIQQSIQQDSGKLIVRASLVSSQEFENIQDSQKPMSPLPNQRTAKTTNN